MTTIKPLSTGKKSGETMLEKHLKSGDFFNADKFPTAEFSFHEAAPTVLKGNLTIKGISNPVEIPVITTFPNGTPHLSGEAKLDRTQWNIRYGSDKFFDNLANNVIDDFFTVSFSLDTESPLP